MKQIYKLFNAHNPGSTANIDIAEKINGAVKWGLAKAAPAPVSIYIFYEHRRKRRMYVLLLIRSVAHEHFQKVRAGSRNAFINVDGTNYI